MAKMSAARQRWPAFVVVFVLLAITIATAYGTHRANRTQERRLLRERASEVALILTDSFASLQTQLSTMAAETALNGADRHSFLSASNALAPASAGFETGLAQRDPASGGIRFVVTTGPLASTPAPVVADLLHRALSVSTQGVTSAVLGTGTRRSLAMAYAVGRNNLAIYEQLPLDFAAAARATTRSEPFHELRVALYAGPKPDPQLLLLTTNSKAPRSGAVVTARAPFGADTWLVTVQATTPLTGSFAAQAYWIVLGAGLVLTGLVGFIVVTLMRRRDYAMGLVAERTEALEASVRELERTQEQLVRSERLAAIGELASVVGHELRNPLGVITNAHYLLRTVLSRGEPDADAVRHLSTAEREVGAATLIVGDLLDYARARAPVTSAVDVADLLTEIQSVLPEPPEVTVRREDAPDLPPVQADRDQLRQVLLNLLSNAYEAVQAAAQGETGPNGGTVTIRTSASGGKVSIAVADTGVGMDDETLAQVFEPFYSRKTRGTGLGLAVTRRIVDSHGGVIRIDSALGSGTTFTVEFPAAETEGVLR
ncbi:MAG TPA: ATP-binding protein [Mycobacteriales bacterium]|nr:ATP-binding protein [Mycobacteriales bacterium]